MPDPGKTPHSDSLGYSLWRGLWKIWCEPRQGTQRKWTREKCVRGRFYPIGMQISKCSSTPEAVQRGLTMMLTSGIEVETKEVHSIGEKSGVSRPRDRYGWNQHRP